MFLGAACRTIVRDKSIPESSLESCLLLCVSHKEAICSQCAFVFITMLLCFACGHHFILRILMCSINSNNHVRVCTLLTEIKTETWWIPVVTRSLITELVGYCTCFQQQWALAQNQSLGRLRNIPPELLTHGPICHQRATSQLRNISDHYRRWCVQGAQNLSRLQILKLQVWTLTALVLSVPCPSLLRPSALFSCHVYAVLCLAFR